jgi:hypothetical protein
MIAMASISDSEDDEEYLPLNEDEDEVVLLMEDDAD